MNGEPKECFRLVSADATFREQSRTLTCNYMTSNRVDMNVLTVNRKVDPIDCESLDKAQYGFTEKRVEAKSCCILIQSRSDFISNNEGNELLCSFAFVLNIYGGVQLKIPVEPGLKSRGKPASISLNENCPCQSE
jgi:hypothetical protein